MKIVVIGGTGLIGSKVVDILREQDHEAVAASPSKGVNALTGEGLEEALRGAEVVVDVANAPSWEDSAVLDFFETSSRNLLKAEKAAGVGHHVALSIVGLELTPNGYFRAKLAQEALIKASTVPYSVVRATQFHSFVSVITESLAQDDSIHAPDAFLQTIAPEDVAAAVARVAVQRPLNDTLDIAGPDALPFSQFIEQLFESTGDSREVRIDAKAGYFGAALAEKALIPQGEAWCGALRFTDWLKQAKAAPAPV